MPPSWYINCLRPSPKYGKKPKSFETEGKTELQVWVDPEEPIG
jgi:hypothetical protein